MQTGNANYKAQTFIFFGPGCYLKKSTSGGMLLLENNQQWDGLLK